MALNLDTQKIDEQHSTLCKCYASHDSGTKYKIAREKPEASSKMTKQETKHKRVVIGQYEKNEGGERA